ncbi:MAG: hypothetical protein RLZZ283_260 [Candidatus Parcubacteria bacterium]|jgi:hypothetical protein
MEKIFKFFWFSITVTVVGFVAMYFYGGWAALLTTLLLTLLEVTLSFDNAVVNARVLKNMNALWQRRFLTWGILIAVFGTRFVLPIVIVSVIVGVNPWTITEMALFDPAHYGELLEKAKYAIHAFGAAFLIMVALKYFLDAKKSVHWIKNVERHLTQWGRVEAIEIVLALIVVAGISFAVPLDARATVLVAGIIGVILFIVMQGVTSAFSVEAKEGAGASLALFIYLEVLDAAFSLDGVIGAFALTSAIPIIAVGLGIGAFFVRSLTIYMVRERTLDTLKYLEHGAHWAIFGLAISMFVSLLTEVPEIVTGTIGIVFVIAAYWSSVLARKAP